MNMFSTNDFYVFGGRNQLGVVSGNGNVILINDPILLRCDIESTPERIEISCTSGRQYRCLERRPGITLHLDILAGGEVVTTDSVPGDIRLADDMTVRQLLAAINRKVKSRP